MNKPEAYADGNYVECEAFAKRAWRPIPTSSARRRWSSRRSGATLKQDQLTKSDKDESIVPDAPRSRQSRVRRPRSTAQGTLVPRHSRI